MASKDLQSVDSSWLRGAKWIGMKESDIEKTERKYNILFSEEYKEFLKILHTIDKKHEESYIGSDDKEYTKQSSYFYNWLTDDEDLTFRFETPKFDIFRDVKRGYWLDSWGERPNTEAEVKRIFDKWYSEAPKLIPLHDHRYVVNQKGGAKNAVISVWGSDTIIIAWSLKHLLLKSLGIYR